MDFLQSKIWREFQASVGRSVFEIEGASIIEHKLPIIGSPACIAKRSIAGRYFYVPRGPELSAEAEINSKFQIPNSKSNPNDQISKIINLGKEKGIGWIRVEPNCRTLEFIKKNIDYKIEKAPHDMQPRETFVIDISKSEEELLSDMKQKTRYNLNLAKKKEIKIIVSREKKHIDEFLRLVEVTSQRDGISSHPKEYYRKMIEMIPEENLRLYLAEYSGKIIVANLVVFFQDLAIYLHGSSDNEFRNVMAPYLLQWRQIQDAKKIGCTKYDFGGIKSGDENNSWKGITKFKKGFSPEMKPTQFLGCYDIILSPVKYRLYRIIQKIKTLF